MARYSGRYRENTRKKRSPLPVVILIVVILVLAAAAVWFFFFGGADKFGIKLGGNTSSESSEISSESAEESAAPSPTAEPTPTVEPTPSPTPSPTPEPTAPPIPDDGSDAYLSEGICIFDNKAFELFYGSDEMAARYAELISSFADQLDGMNVYDMVVPNHSEFGLPERVRNDYGCSSQRQNTQTVYDNLSDKVTPVDVYDVLNLHNNEYLYLNTDTHWGPLGAYYSYTKFCEVSGAETAALDSFEHESYDGYTGYLYYATGESCLEENPDTIDVYNPKFDYSAELSYDGLSFFETSSMNIEPAYADYGVYIQGDNAAIRVTNNELQNGRKLLMVKDSYGNAMAPFLTASFEEVHVIDFRSFEGNLPAYCAENGITDVLFFSNVMPANTQSQLDTMSALFD